MSKPVVLVALVFFGLAAGLLLPAGFHAQAAPPSNDDFDTPYEIKELPFTYRMDISEATYAGDDPLPSCFPPPASLHPEGSVWFAFTPSEDTQMRADTFGSDYYTVISVFTGERGNLVEVVCALSEVSFPVLANTTYDIMVGALPYGGIYPAPPGSSFRSLLLNVSLDPPPPPQNDRFDAATVISSVPFAQLVDNRSASLEPREPRPSCVSGHGGVGKTVWYTFTPVESGVFISDIEHYPFWFFQAIYTGDSIDNLIEADCGYKSLTPLFEAGQTYHIQVGMMYDQGGIFTYSLELTVPPPNDDFDTAKVLPGLPYTDELDTEFASAAPDDPIDCTNNGSVWYAYSPEADQTITADTFGSSYDTALSVYTGERGALVQVPGMCVDDSGDTQSQVEFEAAAGITYYFMIASCCGLGRDGGGSLVFHVRELLPPLNDLFSEAIQVPALPFSDSQNNALADVEVGEPFPSCREWYAPNRTIWYRFTPAERMEVVASYDGFYADFMGVYTGATLDSLVEVGCSGENMPVSLTLEAGQTYSFQLGSQYEETGLLTFSLDNAPPPSADFTYTPGDPTVYELVTFTNLSSPGGEDCLWDFGDGDSAQGCTVTHQYRSDSYYSVTQTVSGPGGEPISTTQIVPVNTHDLVVVRLKTPSSARLGKTESISVRVRSLFYTEMVLVTLYKSTPDGFMEVDTMLQTIPSKPGTRFATIIFRYTFTEEDARIGKVIFKAYASQLTGFDALPCDNELISLPVKVGR